MNSTSVTPLKGMQFLFFMFHILIMNSNYELKFDYELIFGYELISTMSRKIYIYSNYTHNPHRASKGSYTKCKKLQAPNPHTAPTKAPLMRIQLKSSSTFDSIK